MQKIIAADIVSRFSAFTRQTRRTILRAAAAVLLPAALVSAPQAASLPEADLSGRTVRIGTEGLYTPFSFRTASGDWTGYDVEVARETGKRLGVKVEFVGAPWDALIAALDAKRVDAVFNQVVENKARLTKYAVTVPYLEEHGGVVVKTGAANPPVRFEDLKGRRIAGVPSANWVVAAQASGA